uniref:2-oxo-4-hydroxy-4-carboxy-5-ureidoimidazoline decarboxylase n=1 Tax=Alloyangia mangrovi TaxID=1779329 RepID=A0A2A3JV04_9RHOB
MKDDDLRHLRETIRIARESRDAGNHPFGATLVGPDGAVLLRRGNNYSDDKGVGHAELLVAQEASRLYAPEFLESCTLYTSVEPCCMCAGACYWAGIGTVVYGMTEKRLAVLTAHPDLAGKLAQAKRLTAESTAEQAGAGLDALTDEERVSFTELNEAYTSKFGFPFIIAVRDNDKASIMQAFRRRLGNDRTTEFAEACRQVERIAELRLMDKLGA